MLSKEGGGTHKTSEQRLADELGLDLAFYKTKKKDMAKVNAMRERERVMYI